MWTNGQTEIHDEALVPFHSFVENLKAKPISGS